MPNYTQMTSLIKRYSVIFDGTANGVGSTLYLNESLDQFILLIFLWNFSRWRILLSLATPLVAEKISLNPSNLPDNDGDGGGVYEFGLTKSSRTSLTISNDVYFDLEVEEVLVQMQIEEQSTKL